MTLTEFKNRVKLKLWDSDDPLPDSPLENQWFNDGDATFILHGIELKDSGYDYKNILEMLHDLYVAAVNEIVGQF